MNKSLRALLETHFFVNSAGIYVGHLVVPRVKQQAGPNVEQHITIHSVHQVSFNGSLHSIRNSTKEKLRQESEHCLMTSLEELLKVFLL